MVPLVETTFAPIWHYWSVAADWIHKWLTNNAQSLLEYKRCSIFSRSSDKFKGHTGKKKKWPILTLIERFGTVAPLWITDDDYKCYTKLKVAWRRCHILFQGHPSNLKVTWAEKFTIDFKSQFVKFHGHRGHKIDDLDPIWQICLVKP